MNTKDDSKSLLTKEFLSKISHHSRSPFNGLLGFSELLLLNQKKIKSESATDYLLRINMLAKKAFISSENIILFLKLFSNNLTVIKSSTIFSSILEQAYNINKEAFKIKNVEFVRSAEADFTINCDAFLTGNIFSNLISKSLKQCDENSKIIFESKIVKQKRLISISYTGMPIDSETVRTFFKDKNSKIDSFAPELDIELWICLNLANIQELNFKVSFGKNNSTTFSLEI